MDAEWQRAFPNRMCRFEERRPSGCGERSVSIKIWVTSGCFHREHSPVAYQFIDQFLTAIPGDDTTFSFQEHESGPELLVYFAVGTAGITLAKSVIDLITTIIKARSEGVKKGDRPSDPIELIVRRVEGGRRRKGGRREECNLTKAISQKLWACNIAIQGRASHNFLNLSAKSKSVLNFVCNRFAAEPNAVMSRFIRSLSSPSDKIFG